MLLLVLLQKEGLRSHVTLAGEVHLQARNPDAIHLRFHFLLGRRLVPLWGGLPFQINKVPFPHLAVRLPVRLVCLTAALFMDGKLSLLPIKQHVCPRRGSCTSCLHFASLVDLGRAGKVHGRLGQPAHPPPPPPG